MRIYQGETLTGTMIIKDDKGQLITDFSKFENIVVMISNKFDNYSVALQKSDLNIENEKITFTFTPEQTSKLNQEASLEIKLVSEGVVKITKKDLFYIFKNKVKDVV